MQQGGEGTEIIEIIKTQSELSRNSYSSNQRKNFTMCKWKRYFSTEPVKSCFDRVNGPKPRKGKNTWRFSRRM